MKILKSVLETIILILIIVLLIKVIFYRPEDVNKDGIVDIKDLLIVQKYILECK